MKNAWIWLAAAAALLPAGHAAAQTDGDGEGRREAQAEAEIEARKHEIEARDEELEKRLREAEKRLAEAAQRVAELSQERLGALGERGYAFKFPDRPRLGVTVDTSESDDAVEGVRIIGVSPGSTAADAGLRAGDVLTSVDGESMSAASSEAASMRLLEFMETVEEGDRFELEYLRDGKVGTVEVEPRVVEGYAYGWDEEKLVLPGQDIVPKIVQRFRFSPDVWHDIELVELTEDLGRYFGTDEGLLVVRAPKANALKLREGDVIESVGDRQPSSVKHCMRILGSYQPGEKLVLNILRDGKRQRLEVVIPDDRTSSLGPSMPALPARAVTPVAPILPVRPVHAPRCPESARPAEVIRT